MVFFFLPIARQGRGRGREEPGQQGRERARAGGGGGPRTLGAGVQQDKGLFFKGFRALGLEFKGLGFIV